MAVIITDTLHKSHLAPFFSTTGLISVSVLIVTIFLPLLLVIMTHNYWIDTMKYFEQPSVRHMNELMVFMYTDDGAFTFGSTKNLNDLIVGSSEDASALSPQFTVLNHDVNQDGKADQLEINIKFNTDGSKIRNIAVLQTVVYCI